MNIRAVYVLIFAVCSYGLASPTAVIPKYLTLKKIASVSLSPSKSKAQAKIEITVDDGLHVQANPAGAPNLIATQVEIKADETFQVGAPIYPEGNEHQIAGIGKVPTYDGKFEIFIPLELSKHTKSGKIKLNGTLRYQACSEKVCYFPMTIPIVIPVVVKTK